ncbi:MAG TPA: flagellar biosynthetic protein FliO [Candidatus Dormibacteraeota bacterium]|nr:flagellar biosynthetic protein FliO [Candidatus Dormibacteraeota bacterium]
MNASFVYAIAGMAAVCTLFGAVRLFSRRSTEPTTAIVRRDPGAPDAGEEESLVEVVSRTRVGYGGELVLVRFEGRRILLGVTRGQWTALADLGRTTDQKHQDSLSAIDAELNRALHADRMRRGRKGS